jgi:ribosomal protein S18 acetylase RimI-like enzyme
VGPVEDTIIRRATADDAEAIADVHARSWQSAYVDLLPAVMIDDMVAGTARRIIRLRGQLRGPSSVKIWVADQHGAIVGFALIGSTTEPDVPIGTGEVHAIYLAPEAWDKGIGRALMARAVHDLEDMAFERAVLWVLTSNQRARRFYEAAGWRPDGATKVEERTGGSMHEVRYGRTFRAGGSPS